MGLISLMNDSNSERVLLRNGDRSVSRRPYVSLSRLARLISRVSLYLRLARVLFKAKGRTIVEVGVEGCIDMLGTVSRGTELSSLSSSWRI